MGLPDIFLRTGIFAGTNIRVTHALPNEPRSESSIVVDPKNPNRLLGASKRFYDPHAYKFYLAPVFSDDGGATWHDQPPFPLVANHDVYTDPSTTFDTTGAAWVMGDPGFFSEAHPQLFKQLNCSGSDPDAEDIQTTHMLAFKSTNNGNSWGSPIPIVGVRCIGDDKGWIACDNSTAVVNAVFPNNQPKPKPQPKSPFHGHLYAVWGAATPFRFARSLDGGQTWIGANNKAPGADLTNIQCFAPDISIGSDGTLHVFWHVPGTSSIQYLRSTDGGATFHGASDVNGFPQPWTIVSGLTDISSGISTTAGGWPVFEGSNFRVLTIVSACCFGEQGVAVCWADARNGHSRSYYRVSYDNGVTWQGAASGSPMLPNLSGDSHQFHPQLAATGSGVLGCAMYSYSKTARAGNKPGVSVLVAASFDNGVGWDFSPITDAPWDPAINAPWSHGDPSATFIGDYFGFDAGANEFHVLWTDTRFGNQDLFYCRIDTEKEVRPNDDIVATLLTPGTSRDGGGWVIVNGHLYRVPPWDPMREVLGVVAALSSISQIKGVNTARAQEALYEVAIDVAKTAIAGIKAGGGGAQR